MNRIKIRATPKKFACVFNPSEVAPRALQGLFTDEWARRPNDTTASPVALIDRNQVALTIYPDQNIQLHYDHIKLDLQTGNPKYRELLEPQERQQQQAVRDQAGTQQFINRSSSTG